MLATWLALAATVVVVTDGSEGRFVATPCTHYFVGVPAYAMYVFGGPEEWCYDEVWPGMNPLTYEDLYWQSGWSRGEGLMEGSRFEELFSAEDSP